MAAIDLHQHLWPEPVLRALERRADAPRARWKAGSWVVAPAREPAFAVDPAQHDESDRAAAVEAAGLDRALVALSSPLGADALPAHEALPVLDAWLDSAARLPRRLGWWAPLPLRAPSAERRAWLAHALDSGASGLCLPAGALARPDAARDVLDALALLDDWGLPVFVHPGAAAGDPGDPSWWAPCVSYVAELHAAWHGFSSWVRPELPRLRVVFAALAGLAPLHAERLRLRGGADAARTDERTFYEPSSYGPRAVRAMGGAIGTGQLVHGTDHPVVAAAADPVAQAFGDAAASIARRENPARLLGLTWQPA